MSTMIPMVYMYTISFVVDIYRRQVRLIDIGWNRRFNLGVGYIFILDSTAW